MRVVDTSVWIEFYIGSDLGRRLAPEIPEGRECLIPTIVQMELFKWLSREASADAAQLAIADTQQCLVVSLDTQIAVYAAQLAAEFKLSAADAIIYATAREHDARLLTCDSHFRDLPGVIYSAKAD